MRGPDRVTGEGTDTEDGSGREVPVYVEVKPHPGTGRRRTHWEDSKRRDLYFG